MSDSPKTPEKGHKNGECNRTACENTPATWWNQYTQAFYCEPCARRINVIAGRQICCGMKPVDSR